jgi:hypothetical protein
VGSPFLLVLFRSQTTMIQRRLSQKTVLRGFWIPSSTWQQSCFHVCASHDSHNDSDSRLATRGWVRSSTGDVRYTSPHALTRLGVGLTRDRQNRRDRVEEPNGTERGAIQERCVLCVVVGERWDEAITVPLHPYDQRPARMQWR